MDKIKYKTQLYLDCRYAYVRRGMSGSYAHNVQTNIMNANESLINFMKRLNEYTYLLYIFFFVCVRDVCFPVVFLSLFFSILTQMYWNGITQAREGSKKKKKTYHNSHTWRNDVFIIELYCYRINNVCILLSNPGCDLALI